MDYIEHYTIWPAGVKEPYVVFFFYVKYNIALAIQVLESQTASWLSVTATYFPAKRLSYITPSNSDV